MELTTKSVFTLYVVWHPSYRKGQQIAELLHEHFGSDLYRSVGEECAVSVLRRSHPAPGRLTPLPIDWDGSEFTAVVALAETFLIEDPEWVNYVCAIAKAACERGLPARFFPVTMDCRGLELNAGQQSLRWDRWDPSDAYRERRLISDLTHEFCRMLRHSLDQFLPDDDNAFGRYLDKIKVFISHSKHDCDGDSVGNSIRSWIHEHSPLGSFFDFYDIPPGFSFKDVLLHEIRAGALLAVHTDSYSSREWCRREIIEAKRHLVPMVVVDCVRDLDPRAMPYLGNVPVVRMNPDRMDRIGAVAGYLLDEVFRNWLWLCRIRPYSSSPNVLFTPRPPELISLAAVPSCGENAVPVVVYPEPLLATDEELLFKKIAPRVRVLTLTDWLAEHR